MKLEILSEKELENITGAANNSLEQPSKNVRENYRAEQIDAAHVPHAIFLHPHILFAVFNRPAPQTNYDDNAEKFGTVIAGASVSVALCAAAFGACKLLGKYVYNKHKNKKTKPSF